MVHVKAHHSRHRLPRRGSGGPIGVAAIATLVGTVGVAGTALFSPTGSAPPSKPPVPQTSATVQIPRLSPRPAACSTAVVSACNAALNSGSGR